MTLEELAEKLTRIKVETDKLLDDLWKEGITGDIKYTTSPAPVKLTRKRRTKKEIEAGKMEGKSYRFERPEAPLNPPLNNLPTQPQMDLEKRYQADRVASVSDIQANLPDADTGNTFYGKPKKARKKREKKVDGGE
jgi:hypothetical protein